MAGERPTIKTLRSLIERRVRPKTFKGPLSKTGISALDQQLPGGALRKGTLIEIFSHQSFGAGAWRLAFLFLAYMAREARGAYLDCQPKIYPPALAAMGIDLDRLLILRPPDRRLALWSLEQLSSCEIFRLSIGVLSYLRASDLRRLQLAVESSGVFLVLLRPWKELSWRGTGASLRLSIESSPALSKGRSRAFTLKILRGSRGKSRPILLELDGVAGTLSSSSILPC